MGRVLVNGVYYQTPDSPVDTNAIGQQLRNNMNSGLTGTKPLGSQLAALATAHSTPAVTPAASSTPAAMSPASGYTPIQPTGTTGYTNGLSNSILSAMNRVMDPNFQAEDSDKRYQEIIGNPTMARAELSRDKSMYNDYMSKGDTADAQAAHSWADRIRQGAGISNDDPVYGNGTATPAQAAQTTQTPGTPAPAAQPVTSPNTAASILTTLVNKATNGPASYQQTINDYNTAEAQRQADAQKSSQAYIDAQTNRINDFYTNTQAAQQAQLRAALNTGLAQYANQANVANQQNYNDRNSTDADYMRSLQALKEGLANSGLSSSGDAGTLGVSLANQNQNALRQIDQGTTNTLNQIAAQRGALTTNEANQETALQQQLDADKAQQLMNLNQYGDQRAIQLDNTGYQRYADMLNRNLQQNQLDFNNQLQAAQLMNQMQNADRQYGLDVAGLTGQFNGDSTLAGKQANLNAALQVGSMLGRVVSPTQTWGDLFNQTNAPMNLQGMSTMAQLTGYIPDGNGNMVPTTAEQQRQLQNEWNVADQTGKITPTLAQTYGIPEGTPTMDAMLKMAQANYYNDHGIYYDTRAGMGYGIGGGGGSGNPTVSNLLDIWKASGKAPAGIPGVAEGTPYTAGSSGGGSNANNAIDFGKFIDNSQYIQKQKDDNTGATKTVVTNPDAVESMILSSGLPESEMIKLYQKYLPGRYNPNGG